MSLFKKSKDRPIKLSIKQDRIRDLKRGYPWIFAHSLIDLPPAPPGSFAIIRDREGEIIAKGMYDPSCPIVFRVCALEEELSDISIREKIRRALTLRRPILSSETTACRMLNGEGDGLPGLICDRFDRTAVVQLDGAAPSGFWNIELMAKYLAEEMDVERVYLKPRSGSSESGRMLIGSSFLGPARFLENGVQFEADLIHGAKTGFFLDQRDNRQRIGSLARGQEVLNLFAYTGGFSLYAGRAGAKHVTTVDIAKPAIEGAIQNWMLNSLPSEMHEAVVANVIDYMEDLRKKGQHFDLVIADPPSFAPSKAAYDKGRGAYVSLLSQCAAATRSGGILAASSCSSHVSTEQFLEICQESISRARRRVTVLGVHGQPLDHPFPLACRELQYLKFVILHLN